MAPGNAEQMVHYHDTIKNRVPQARIFDHVSSDLRTRLTNIFGSRTIAVWGSRNTPANRTHFDKMRPGDVVLIIVGHTIQLLGKIAEKTLNHDLSA